MERHEFCKGAKCAKLTVEIEGENPLVLISKAPSLILEKEEIEEEGILIHEMTAPIEEEFPFVIEKVECFKGLWFFNVGGTHRGSDIPVLDCPMPGTYPVITSGGMPNPKDRESTTDLYWSDNKLFCYFDSVHRSYYTNNFGICTYRVIGKKTHYQFFDKQGMLYTNNLGKKLTYKVECDACCKDNEILCDSKHYPGYSCYPISPVNSRLLKGKNNIARFWR